ncbi:uncharacterized protein KY384_007373 [Bacidia gigantensis]|uniref:uncharacterized protein n=1 Tax=Bacidia gigantensis TaxID=2732470 RepID=UPI001D05AA5F|nr:uncharacterized protein KY384_007373 [Bacidia gigantensis]KAG8528455.1 hypothetical protein KY384_007373 [Bacidia gigantensis]
MSLPSVITSGLSDAELITDKNRWAVDQNDTLIKELETSLSENAQVLTPQRPGYKQAIIRWSDAIEKTAGVVVYPKTAEDVKACLAFSQQHSIDFVVAGGKHSSSGASSTDNGLVIDMAKMREVTVYPESKTLRVQGGCIWRDVDEAAAEYGLAMVGGTVNHTGVGGLTLGGGYGWLSGEHGLTVDNLLEAEMVLADGSIKKCSEKENSDLFWAIRGAGHSFGVATEFTFQGVEQKEPIWAGAIVFNPAETLEPVVQAMNNLKATNDPKAGVAMALGPPPFLPRPGIVCTCFYRGPQEKAEEVFGEFLVIPAIKKDLGMRPYCTMNSMLNNVADYGGRKCTKGASAIYPLSPIFVASILTELELFQKSLPNNQARRTMVNIDMYSTDKWCSVPRDAMSFYNRGDYQNVIIGPYWIDAEHDQTARAWGRHIHSRFRLEIDWRKQTFNDAAASQDIREYGNYDGTGASSQTIFGTNYPRLASLKAQYDPSDRFNKDYGFASASRAASAVSSPTPSAPSSIPASSEPASQRSTAPSSPKSENSNPVEKIESPPTFTEFDAAATGLAPEQGQGDDFLVERAVEQHVRFKGYNPLVAQGSGKAVEAGTEAGGAVVGVGDVRGAKTGKVPSGVLGEENAFANGSQQVGFEDPAAVWVEGDEGGRRMRRVWIGRLRRR